MKYVTTIERMAEEQSIAMNFLKENIPIETIARATGLTIEQLQTLQDQMN
jgi:hypothetical protein